MTTLVSGSGGGPPAQIDYIDDPTVVYEVPAGFYARFIGQGVSNGGVLPTIDGNNTLVHGFSYPTIQSPTSGSSTITTNYPDVIGEFNSRLDFNGYYAGGSFPITITITVTVSEIATGKVLYTRASSNASRVSENLNIKAQANSGGIRVTMSSNLDWSTSVLARHTMFGGPEVTSFSIPSGTQLLGFLGMVELYEA